jgi:membrane protease YdiL (CAAX protease family)
VAYGGVNEEVLMRLFLVSLLAWLLARAWRRDAPAPGARMMWSAIVVVSVLFGLGHLPAAAMLGELTPDMVARVIVLNAVAGVAFGWLFWRRGLEAAMVAHAAAHLPMQVLANLAV